MDKVQLFLHQTGGRSSACISEALMQQPEVPSKLQAQGDIGSLPIYP